MSQLKKCQVVMLPTKKAEDCLYLQNGSKLYYHKGYLTQEYLKFSLNAKSYHLYIISDEDLILGDWYYTEIINKSIHQAINERLLYLAKTYNCKKIIATTDKLIVENDKGKSLLGTDLNTYLSQPSQSFIQKYIEEYNKGNIITEAMVEYEIDIINELSSGNTPSEIALKINPKDNTITIRPIKDSWTREEVESLINLAWATASAYGDNTDSKDCQDWIKHNL